MPETIIIPPPPPEPHEEELQVGPVEAESAAEVLARIERRDCEEPGEIAEPEPMEPHRENLTFTLKQLLIVITVLSVWLGVLRWLSALKMSVLTGLTGVAALAALFWLSMQQDQAKIIRVIAWGMLLVYVICSVATWMTG